MKFLADLLIRAFVLLITTYVVPGFHIKSYWTAILVALVLGLLNALVKPILVILTLPVTILTLGLFVFVINAFLLMIASVFIDGFKVDSFVTAIIASIVITVVSTILNTLIR